MKKESVKTTAIFTPADDGYVVTFPAVPELVFHTAIQIPNSATLEDIADNKAADKALEEYRQTGKSYSLAEIKAELGL